MYLTEEQDKMYRDNEGLVFFSYSKYIKKLRDLKRLNAFDVNDIIQAGSIGLMHACKTYDQSRDIQFSTYAVPLITNAMRIEIRQLEKYKHNSVSLDAKIRSERLLAEGDESNLCMRDLDILNTYEDVETKVINRIILDRINCMRDPWQTIAKMIAAGYTYEEIGKMFGCTRERIGQRVEQIRDFINADPETIKVTARNICASRPQM